MGLGQVCVLRSTFNTTIINSEPLHAVGLGQVCVLRSTFNNTILNREPLHAVGDLGSGPPTFNSNYEKKK